MHSQINQLITMYTTTIYPHSLFQQTTPLILAHNQLILLHSMDNFGFSRLSALLLKVTPMIHLGSMLGAE